MVFDLQGNFLNSYGGFGQDPGELASPTGVKVGPDGNIWVADRGNNRIQVFTPDGKTVRVFGSFGADPGQLNSPTSFTFDRDGNVYISEWTGSRIQIFTLDGQLIGEVAPGTFTGPHGIAIDSTGALYVADTGNDVIRKFERVDSSGSPDAPAPGAIELGEDDY